MESGRSINAMKSNRSKLDHSKLKATAKKKELVRRKRHLTTGKTGKPPKISYFWW
jgi:hypothetical protein